MKKCSVLKKLLALLAVAAIAGAIVYVLFKKGILPINKEEEEEFDDAEFDEDLSDLFDDFNDDATVIQITREEEAPAEEEVPAAEETPAEE